MSDYGTVKKQILHKYLVDVPTVANVRPHAFLLSDMYHYLKTTKNGNTLRPLLRTWVSELSNDFIPISTLNDFMHSPYFGQCDQNLLNLTQREFTLGPLNAFYDAGVYGELWENKNVELKGPVTPFAKALFDMARYQNEDLFAHVQESLETPVRITPHGALERPLLPATSIGTIYDPFIEEFATANPTSCDNISCGIAKNIELTEQELLEIESYINAIAMNRNLIIGGGVKVDYLEIYNNIKDISINMTKHYLAESTDAFVRCLDSEYIPYINGLLNKKEPSILDVQELYYAMQFSCNRIFDQNFSLLWHVASSSSAEQKTMNKHVNDKIINLFGKIKKIIKDVPVYGTVLAQIKNDGFPTLEHGLLSCGPMNYTKLEFDLVPGVEKMICKRDTNYVLEANINSKIYQETITPIDGYRYNQPNEHGVVPESHHSKNFNELNGYIIMSSVFFMRSCYYPLLKNALPTLPDTVIRSVECIALTYDYIIIKLDTENGFYGAVL